MTGVETVTIIQIAESKGITRQAVEKRAKKEKWQFEQGSRQARLYYIDRLPEDLRMAVIAHRAKGMEQRVSDLNMILPARADLDLGQARALLNKFENAPVRSREKSTARGEVVDCFDRFTIETAQGSRLKAQGKTLTKLKIDFVKRYNAGNDGLGISSATYDIIDQVSVGSLNRWRADKRMLGLAGLLDEIREKECFCGLSEAQKQYIIDLKVNKIHRRPVRICEYVRNKFAGQDLPSNATIRRFIKQWETDNAEYVEFLRNPDKWRSEYQAAFGDSAEKALHYLHMLEFDNTPADVMCADGKRYTICGAIDIFSRKAKVIVVPTSKSQSIANLMRRVILEWGLFDVMIKDNGQDYASKHIDVACTALQIETPLLPKFSPELKPHIERFFRTMTEGLFEEIKGFTGHSVAQAQDLRAAKSFAERMFSRGEVVECGLRAEELRDLIDAWLRDVYHQREHGSLGKSPEARAGESTQPVRRIMDERVLDILLAPAGTPTVSKKGIRHANGIYTAVELADRVGQQVRIRRDLADAATLYVFDKNFSFVCIAKDQALEGLSVEDLNVARARQKKRVRETVKAMKTMARSVGDPMSELLESRARENGRVVGFQRYTEFESEEVREALKALENGGGEDDSLYFEPEEIAEDPASPEGFAVASKVVPLREEEPWFETGMERCKYLMQQEKIRVLNATEGAWLEGYQATEEYYRIFVMPYEI